MKQHTTPCSDCPFKTTSTKGWLGAATPIEFLAQSEAGLKMPCHLHVDYESEDWQEQLFDAPQCAGRAIHLANRCKIIPGVMKAKPDRETVFTSPQDFINHHTVVGEPEQILIVGTKVLTRSMVESTG